MSMGNEGTTNRCKKMEELPHVVGEWQQKAWRPACDLYSDGQCVNLMSEGTDAPCPFEGRALPLREVTVETVEKPNDQMRQRLFEALAQAIKLRVMGRTGGRIQALEVKIKDDELWVRGTAPCYYIKQLAQCAAIDVLRSNVPVIAGLRIEVNVVSTTASARTDEPPLPLEIRENPLEDAPTMFSASTPGGCKAQALAVFDEKRSSRRHRPRLDGMASTRKIVARFNS